MLTATGYNDSLSLPYKYLFRPDPAKYAKSDVTGVFFRVVQP